MPGILSRVAKLRPEIARIIRRGKTSLVQLQDAVCAHCVCTIWVHHFEVVLTQWTCTMNAHRQ